MVDVKRKNKNKKARGSEKSFTTRALPCQASGVPFQREVCRGRQCCAWEF